MKRTEETENVCVIQPCEWFALRVTYSREVRTAEVLRQNGFRTFVPMTVRTVEKDGVKRSETVPAVNNLCFVFCDRALLDDFLEGSLMRSYVHYYYDRETRKPITVPGRAMEDFIRVSESRMEGLIYLNEVSPKLRAGLKVRVSTGPFAGIEGKIVRIRRSRRVMVELPGMLAVATNYIPVEDLEILQEQ